MLDKLPAGSQAAAVNSTRDTLLKAIDLALDGEWDAAHRLVQDHQTDATASWIHAVLHKIEGDHENSRYWYARAGKLDHLADDAATEFGAIRLALAESAGG